MSLAVIQVKTPKMSNGRSMNVYSYSLAPSPNQRENNISCGEELDLCTLALLAPGKALIKMQTEVLDGETPGKDPLFDAVILVQFKRPPRGRLGNSIDR